MATNGRRVASDATVLSLSDREFLHLVNDATNEEGWASTGDIAEVIGLPVDNPRANVGSRCGHMLKFGMLNKSETRTEDGQTLWGLTPLGEQFMNGTLRKNVSEMMERVQGGALLEVINMAARRMNASPYVRIAGQREFRHANHRYRI